MIFFVNCTDGFLMRFPRPKPQTEAKRPENIPKICELSPCLNKGQKEGGKRPTHPLSPPTQPLQGRRGREGGKRNLGAARRWASLWGSPRGKKQPQKGQRDQKQLLVLLAGGLGIEPPPWLAPPHPPGHKIKGNTNPTEHGGGSGDPNPPVAAPHSTGSTPRP